MIQAGNTGSAGTTCAQRIYPEGPGAQDPGGVSLIVEGGGMRGFFSAGILKRLAQEGIRFPYVIGVSSGAINALRFVAGRYDVDFDSLPTDPLALVRPRGFVDPRGGLLKTDALYGILCDGCLEGLRGSAARFLVPATRATTAELEWWDNADLAASPAALRERIVASGSIPVVMPAAHVDGELYADGGIRDSIPIDRAESDGLTRHVMILSHESGYVKGTQHLELYLRHWLRPYPKLKRAMLERHLYYNLSMRRADAAEREGTAFCFRMERQRLGRFEYSPAKFREAFEDGLRAADERMPELLRWLGDDGHGR